MHVGTISYKVAWISRVLFVYAGDAEEKECKKRRETQKCSRDSFERAGCMCAVILGEAR